MSKRLRPQPTARPNILYLTALPTDRGSTGRPATHRGERRGERSEIETRQVARRRSNMQTRQFNSWEINTHQRNAAKALVTAAQFA